MAHPLLPRTQPDRLQPAGLHPGEAGHLRGRDKAGDRLGDEDSAAETKPGPRDTEGSAIAMVISIVSRVSAMLLIFSQPLSYMYVLNAN